MVKMSIEAIQQKFRKYLSNNYKESDTSVVITCLRFTFPIVEADNGRILKFLWDILPYPHTVKQFCQFLCHRYSPSLIDLSRNGIRP